MSNLYFKASFGAGAIVTNGQVKNALSDLPDKYRDRYNKEFSILVFGDGVDPRTAKSKVFPCRNLIANIVCTFINDSDSCFYEKCVSDSVEAVKSVSNNDSFSLVMVRDILFDATEDETRDIFSNLYSMIGSVVKDNFNTNKDLVVHLDCDKELYNTLKKVQPKWYNPCDIVKKETGATLLQFPHSEEYYKEH